MFLLPLLLTALTIVFRLSQRIPAIFICVQMKLSYVLFQLFLSFIIFCLLDLIICSKTTLNGWLRKPNAHEKHTGQNERIVPKCTTALLIPEFFSLSKLQRNVHEKHTGQKERIVQKCTAALLIPEFLFLLKLQETYIMIKSNLNYVN